MQIIKVLFNKLQFCIFEVFSWTKGMRSEGRLPSGRFLTCQGCFFLNQVSDDYMFLHIMKLKFDKTYRFSY